MPVLNEFRGQPRPPCISLEGPERPQSDACYGTGCLASDLRACAGSYGDVAIDLTVESYSFDTGWLAVLLYRARNIGLEPISKYLMKFIHYRALELHMQKAS